MPLRHAAGKSAGGYMYGEAGYGGGEAIYDNKGPVTN